MKYFIITVDNFFVDFANDALRRNACEIAFHLQGWNNSPYYELKPLYGCGPFLIEYPVDYEAKIVAQLETLFQNLTREVQYG
jgi:hypothetical protein